jgi:undecaprenyl-diphosphatase
VPARRCGLAGAVCLLAFTALLVLAVTGDLNALDRSLTLRVHDLLGTRWFGAARAVSTAGGPVVRTVVVALLAGCLVLRGRRWTAAFAVAGVGGVGLLDEVLKLLVRRPRPALFPWGTAADGYGFPSGHTAGTAALGAGLFVLVLTLTRRSGLRWLAAFAALAAVAAVAGARVVLGVHRVGDVTAGALEGGGMILVLAATLGRRMEAESRPRV